MIVDVHKSKTYAKIITKINKLDLEDNVNIQKNQLYLFYTSSKKKKKWQSASFAITSKS